MKNTFKALMLIGMGLAASQIQARAQSIILTVTPVAATFTTRYVVGMTATVQNLDTADASGVTVHISFSKGLKIAEPAQCTSDKSGISCPLNTVAAGTIETLAFDLAAGKTGSYS